MAWEMWRMVIVAFAFAFAFALDCFAERVLIDCCCLCRNELVRELFQKDKARMNERGKQGLIVIPS